MSNRSACIFSQRRVGGEAETSGLRYRGGTLVRTERLLSVAAILAQATFVCCGSAAQSASPPAPSGSTAVELVKALAWPLATLLIGVVFHRQIALFMSALGSSITKLSLFKVELELVPATAATTTPLLDAIRGWKPLGRVSKSRFSLSPFANAPQLPVGAQWLPHPGTLSIVHTENFIRRSINAMQHCYIQIVWLARPPFRLLECR